MNTSTLHITSGDTTTNYLKKRNISGDFITWREMLCEGKTSSNVGSETFWKTRFEFLKSSYQVSKHKFINYTLKEYRRMCNKRENNEIVLWFDYDLFCQINMIAIISWLKQHRKGYQICLVSSKKIKNGNKIISISELSKAQLQQQYNSKITLTQDDIEYADYIWQLYCSNSPLRLETLLKNNPSSPFTYLTAALQTHLQRFPSIENGLNNVENLVLSEANNHKLLSKKQLIHQLIENQKTLGLGALQYNFTIDQLQKSFTSFNPVKLSKKGKELLENQVNFYSQIRNENSYLGGAKKYSFLYSNATNKLLQITS
ncbi:MAG: DUF1835 domain-containing protein [Polaribacter sp.]